MDNLVPGALFRRVTLNSCQISADDMRNRYCTNRAKRLYSFYTYFKWLF